MKKFIKENWFKLGILLLILFIGVSFFYYLMFFKPEQESIKKNNLNRCLSGADVDYRNRLNEPQEDVSNCKDLLKTNPYRNLKQTKEEEAQDNLDCLNMVVTKYSNILKDEKEKCYKLYPQY